MLKSLFDGSARLSVSPKVSSFVDSSSLQVLKYNDLDLDNGGIAAILIHDQADQQTSKARCEAIGEKLYSLNAPSKDIDELKYQLDYLLFTNSLQEDDLLWMSNDFPSDLEEEHCWAYSLSQKSLVQRSCGLKLPAVCGNSAPPTTDKSTSSDIDDLSKISVTLNDNSTVTGYRDARSFRFLGVPFADPPLGDLRFAPPQPYSGQKVIDATKRSPGCIQRSNNPLYGDVSEDCLYLNIQTPFLPKTGSKTGSAGVTPKPVALYMHGGSFMEGTGASLFYDGTNFASRNDVVFVTINYRLGPLGFLTTGDLTTGNNGIRDQIQALKWVQEHIGSFGGDPSRVTIVGESAGGQSVLALLSSPAASGLFSAAIAQSIPFAFPWYTKEVYTDLILPPVASGVGCNATASEEALVSCLRSVPASNFSPDFPGFEQALGAFVQAVAANYMHMNPFLLALEPIVPMVDDAGSGLIPDQFQNMLASQSLPNSVPTMVTHLKDESTLFANFFPQLPLTQEALVQSHAMFFPPELAKDMIESQALQIDVRDPDGIRHALLDSLTGDLYNCPLSTLFGHGRSSALPSLYIGEISRGILPSAFGVLGASERCFPNSVYNATCHASDIIPIWGNLNTGLSDQNLDLSDVQHSQLLNDMFGSFFHTFDPNPDPVSLKMRGPAYATSYEVFGDQRNRLVPNDPDSELVDVHSIPIALEDKSRSKKCNSFDRHGYIFNHAKFTGH